MQSSFFNTTFCEKATVGGGIIFLQHLEEYRANRVPPNSYEDRVLDLCVLWGEVLCEQIPAVAMRKIGKKGAAW